MAADDIESGTASLVTLAVISSLSFLRRVLWFSPLFLHLPALTKSRLLLLCCSLVVFTTKSCIW